MLKIRTLKTKVLFDSWLRDKGWHIYLMAFTRVEMFLGRDGFINPGLTRAKIM